MRPVVLYLQPGSVSQTRQAVDCLEHCNLRRYRIVAVVRPHGPQDAVAIVVAGRAQMIVTAYSPRTRPGDLRDLAGTAGVRVEYVRPPVLRREVGQLVAVMVDRAGGDAHLVAEQLGITSQEIRTTLARLRELRDVAPPTSRRRGGRRQNGL